MSTVVTIQGTLYYYPPKEEHHVHEPSLLFSEMVSTQKEFFPLKSRTIYDFYPHTQTLHKKKKKKKKKKQKKKQQQQQQQQTDNTILKVLII